MENDTAELEGTNKSFKFDANARSLLKFNIEHILFLCRRLEVLSRRTIDLTPWVKLSLFLDPNTSM